MQDIMIYMYKVKHGLAPKHIPDIFTVKATQYSLRNSDYFIPRFNTVVYGNRPFQIVLGTFLAQFGFGSTILIREHFFGQRASFDNFFGKQADF